MNGRQFIQRIRRLGRRTGTPVRVNTRRGKGGHVTLWYGDRFTMVSMHPSDLPAGTFRSMCRQLGIGPRDL